MNIKAFLKKDFMDFMDLFKYKEDKILTKEDYFKKGYSVVYSDKEHITLEKAKVFDLGWYFFWTIITIGAALLFYPLYYLIKSNDKVTLERSPNSEGDRKA